jgi:hemerythrin-like domain-containing protein
MNDSIKLLTDEHVVISTACEISDRIAKLIGKKDSEYEDVARQLLSFFREYGDAYHHFKEEKILFPEMNKKNEMIADGIIKEMLENHEDFRELLRGVEDFLNKKDYLRAQQQFHIYKEVLLDHIAVENDEVFHVADALFSPTENENINFRFADCDHELGLEKKKNLALLIQNLDNSVK